MSEIKVNLFHFNRDVQFFIFGQFFSVFGDALVSMALTWWVLSSNNLASGVAALLVPAMIFRLVVSPFLGPVADRFSRKHLMLFADLSRSLLIGILALLAFVWHFE